MISEARGTEGQLRRKGGAISASRLDNALIVKLWRVGEMGEVDVQTIPRTSIKVYTYMYMYVQYALAQCLHASTYNVLPGIIYAARALPGKSIHV